MVLVSQDISDIGMGKTIGINKKIPGILEVWYLDLETDSTDTGIEVVKKLDNN